MENVLVFGAFDPLHKGHEYLFRKAREAGDALTVVVARDSTIRAYKGRDPHVGEEKRLAAVQRSQYTDKVMLGDKDPQHYHLLSSLDFDVLALGYDQQPSDGKVRELLDDNGKPNVRIVRLPAWHPHIYKSSYFRE